MAGAAADFDVVIATRDRPALLAACLESLEDQAAGRANVIVVDDAGRVPVGDADGGVLVLRNDRRLGPGASRNRGVAAGSAPRLLFLDDDVRAHPELLQGHAAVFASDGDPVVSIGALRAPPDVRLPVWDLWQADRLAREQRRLESGEATASWAHVYTGNLALRRADFEAVGGFDTAFERQEDVELGRRLAELGCRFEHAPAALAWHHACHTLADWLQIPAASARYDLQLGAAPHAPGEHHALLLAARRMLTRPAAGKAAERLAIAAGRTLHRLGADRLALPAFSLVWDLEYRRALAAAAPRPRAPRSPP